MASGVSEPNNGRLGWLRAGWERTLNIIANPVIMCSAGLAVFALFAIVLSLRPRDPNCIRMQDLIGHPWVFGSTTASCIELAALGAMLAALTVEFVMLLALAKQTALRASLKVLPAIFIQSCLLYFLMAGNIIAPACEATAAVGHRAPGFYGNPIKSVYFFSTSVPIVGLVSSLPSGTHGAQVAADMLSIAVAGVAFSVLYFTSSAVLWIIAAIVGAGAYCWLLRRFLASLRRVLAQSTDTTSVRLVWVFAPIMLLFWITAPIVILCGEVGMLSSSTVRVLYPFLDVPLKLAVTIGVSFGGYNRAERAVTAELELMSRRRAAAEASQAAIRQMTRYIFHEIRIPLNAMVLAVDELKEDVPAFVQGTEGLLSALSMLSPAACGSGGAAPLPPDTALDSLCVPHAELPTPLLAAVPAQVQLMLASARSAVSVLQTVQDSTSVMTRLLDNALSLAKIEAGKVELQDCTFSIMEQLVREPTSVFSSVLSRKQLRLRVEVAAEVPLQMVGDVNKLRGVLSNFLSNAVKVSVWSLCERPRGN
jgi:signal transduction histidine kinase